MSNALQAFGLLASTLLLSPGAAQDPEFGWLRRMIPADNDWTQKVTFGDIDGDGDADVFLANTSTPSRLYLNTGRGRFVTATPSQFPTDLTGGGQGVFADVDGDRDLDLFVAQAQQNRLLLNDGNGNFTDVTGAQMPTDSDLSVGVVAGDVDGDRDIDFVVGTNGSTFNNNPSRLYLNDGRGSFTFATSGFPVQVERVLSVAMGDVDGDNDLDVVLGVADTARRSNRLLLNNGSGVFTDATTGRLPANRDATQRVLLVDVDQDRDLDLLVVNSGSGSQASGQCRLQQNDGAGTFTDVTATHLPARTELTIDGVLADVDGDGDPDLLLGVLASFSGRGQNRLYLNDGAGRFTDAPVGSLPVLNDPTRAVALHDVDGDGDQDAWIGNNPQNNVHGQDVLLLNDGKGTFADATAPSFPSDGTSTFGLALADFDADGDLDIYASNANLGAITTGQNGLYLNDGSGQFTDVTATNLPEDREFGFDVATGDVDGNGTIDVIVGNQSRPARLYLNDGNAKFTQATNFPFTLGNTFGVELFDADGDNDLDVFFAVASSQSFGRANRLFLNDGKGVFTDVSTTNIPVDQDWGNCVTSGDVDGDGDLDLLIGNSASGIIPRARLYLNDGNGVFTDATSQIAPLNRAWTYEVALVDIDGDKDLDAVLATARNFNTDGQTRVYVNDGKGNFTYDANRFPTQARNTYAMAVADLDGDGDQDLVLGNQPLRTVAGGNQVFRNDGRGNFSLVGEIGPAASEEARSLAIADLDQDGDPDVVLGNVPNRNRVLTNLRRQIAWREVPRVGQRMILDIYGPANGGWGVCLTLRRARFQTGLGTLLLDLTTSILDTQGSLDGDGRAKIEFGIPNMPALVGAVGYWQGMIGPQARLSNLEITTVRGY